MESETLKRLDLEKREALKKLLRCVPLQSFMVFKRMYSHHNLNAGIDEVVDSMKKEDLDWAITQCDNTIRKIVQNKKEKV